MFDSSLGKIRLTNYFLSALIVVAVLLLIRDIISFSLLKKGPPATALTDKTSRQSAPERENLMSFSSILEKNPFGSPSTLHPITVSQIDEKADRDMSLSELVLVGTAVGSRYLSYAILQDKTQPQGIQEIFKLGDDVFH